MKPSQEFGWSRRAWLEAVSVGMLSTLAGVGCQRNLGSGSRATQHPHLFFTLTEQPGLRSLASLRRAITQPGLARDNWETIRAQSRAEFYQPVITPRTALAGRTPESIAANNPDFYACEETGQKLLRHALALHLTEDARHKTAALAQMEALFDPRVWPDWIDHAHMRFGHPADLRTGMLSQDVGMAYDWLYPYLTPAERADIVSGLGRRGIQPFLTSMAQDPWWAQDLNNWYSVIIGGLGVAGMALGEDHAEATNLVTLSHPMMQRYLSSYGEEGEFNESVAYSNATRIPVIYFLAYAYHHTQGQNPLTAHPFPQTAQWTHYLTLPLGRYANFGDSWADRKPMVGFMAAIAAANRDPVLQAFVARHFQASTDPRELLWYDPEVPTTSAEGRWPRAKVFFDKSAQFVSRSSWDPEAPAMIVYGKAKRDHNHAHNDVGQVCIDARGEQMITDPGAPSGYPADFFDEGRWFYYNASIRGHNVLMFADQEQRSPLEARGAKSQIDWETMNGEILGAAFDDERGGFWQVDLTKAYDHVLRVRRTVLHLLPGYAAVLDEATLPTEQAISLRWHTRTPSPPDQEGHFVVQGKRARLACRVDVQGQTMRRHAYAPPYDRERSGGLLEARKEPYVETTLTSDRVEILTLFALDEAHEVRAWQSDVPGRWLFPTATGDVKAHLTETSFSLRESRTGRQVSARRVSS